MATGQRQKKRGWLKMDKTIWGLLEMSTHKGRINFRFEHVRFFIVEICETMINWKNNFFNNFHKNTIIQKVFKISKHYIISIIRYSFIFSFNISYID